MRRGGCLRNNKYPDERIFIPHSELRIWNILDIFRQTEQNIFIPWVKEEISNDEEQHDDKKS